MSDELNFIHKICEKQPFIVIKADYYQKQYLVQKDLLLKLSMERDELSAKIGQLEQYAEFGRLAVDFFDAEYCNLNVIKSAFKDGVNDNCRECVTLKVCQKRAELLAEVQS